jgi:hypothetical protein
LRDVFDDQMIWLYCDDDADMQRPGKRVIEYFAPRRDGQRLMFRFRANHINSNAPAVFLGVFRVDETHEAIEEVTDLDTTILSAAAAAITDPPKLIAWRQVGQVGRPKPGRRKVPSGWVGDAGGWLWNPAWG